MPWPAWGCGPGATALGESPRMHVHAQGPAAAAAAAAPCHPSGACATGAPLLILMCLSLLVVLGV
jgi:hypothetical protein